MKPAEDVQMLLLTSTASPIIPLIPPWCCVSLFTLQAWLCLIALGVPCLDTATRRQNDTTILIQRQPEFDT